MENIWRDIVESNLPEEDYRKLSQNIKERNNDVIIRCDMTNVICGGESKEGVFLSFETGITNAFDVVYRNHEKEATDETGSLIINFDNKLSIDNTISILQKLRQKFDEKEDKRNG